MALTISRNKTLQQDAIDRAAKKGARGPKEKGGKGGQAGSGRAAGGQGRFVLFVGDEGAILTYTNKTTVQRRLFAASPAPEHVEQMRALLDSDPKAPIWMLLDSMDQSYQRQTLPPVAKVSLGKIIQRRLDRDFAASDIKGALEIGREKTGRKDWNYLLVAVSTTGHVMEWMDILLDRSNPFKGLFLSPVESEGLILGLAASTGNRRAAALVEEDDGSKEGKKLAKAKAKAIPKAKKGDSTFAWQLLISHHKVGGFRLVVLNEGRLTFTRLAQPVGDTTPDVVAGNVEQEAVNTIEYMKRMGYHDGEDLQVLIIASQEIKQSLEPKNIPATSTSFFTPAEAADALNLSGVAQPEDHYADILQSVHLLTLKKHRLVLHSPQTKKIAGLTSAAMGLRALAACIALGLAGYGLWMGWQGFAFGAELERMETEKKSQQVALDHMQEIMKQFPGDVKQMLDVLRLYRQYGKATKFFPITAMAGAATLPQEQFGMGSVKWSRGYTGATSGTPVEKLDFSFAGEVYKSAEDNLPSLKLRLGTLLAKASEAFPDAKVEYSDRPQIFNDTSELKTTIGGSGQNDAFQKMMSEPLKVEFHVTSPKPDPVGGAGR